jgi:crotonobetainyl-CoA:carnitine CoA-transferase CaiB-like acyl-CoA transferase
MGPGFRRDDGGGGCHAYAHTRHALDLAKFLPLLGPNNHLGANGSMGPLKGVKIIDMTTVLMGPYATQMLGDYGADVIKVESLDGDVTRQIGPTRHAGMGPVFLNTNRSKRSICLDLKKPAGREAVLRLIRDADVLVYNVRPQAMARLQLGYDVVSQINPRLVYAGVFGFGQDGPYAAKPAYDDLIQGATALPALTAQTSEDGVPRYVPNALVDRIVGLTAVGAICASLVHRDKTGQGQRVDIPMFETMASFVMGDHMGGLTYDPPLDKGGYARHLSRDRRPYKTSDGYICVIVYNDKQWENFFTATGRDDLRKDPKFATFAGRATNIDHVYAELARILETKSTDEWMQILTTADVPVMPMHDLESLLGDPHMVATDRFPVVDHPTEGKIRSMKVSASWSQTQVETPRLAPRLGEHSAEVLRGAGFSEDEIAAMVRDGVTKLAG